MTSHPAPASSPALSTAIVSALLASAVAAGFLLFPGCARCCPDRAVGQPMPTPRTVVTATATATVVVAPAAVAKAEPPPAAPAKPADADHGIDAGLTGADAEAAKVLHNYHRVSPNLASAASPETDAEFAALAKAGIKSIVSVDGAKPPADLARKHGIRYVHVPIGYDGISAPTALELAKTFATLQKDGPILVHCHHGKHRGPAACSIGRMVLDGVTADTATAWMKQAGTDPKYTGLYASVHEFNVPSEADLATVEAPMLEAAPTPALRQSMVDIDAHWEALKIVRKAKWGATPDHPDIDPPHQATILGEAFRELGRHADVASRPDDFKAWLAKSDEASVALSQALRKGAVDAAAAEAQFTVIADACVACHKTHRDHALGK